MLSRLFGTDDSIVPLVLRLTLGIVMLPHGLQKTVGLFGGHGFSGTMDLFVKGGTPAALAFLVISRSRRGPSASSPASSRGSRRSGSARSWPARSPSSTGRTASS